MWQRTMNFTKAFCLLAFCYSVVCFSVTYVLLLALCYRNFLQFILSCALMALENVLKVREKITQHNFVACMQHAHLLEMQCSHTIKPPL